MIVYIHINSFTQIIFFDDCIGYTETFGVAIVLQLSQYNGIVPLPWLKKVNYPVIQIYGRTCR